MKVARVTQRDSGDLSIKSKIYCQIQNTIETVCEHGNENWHGFKARALRDIHQRTQYSGVSCVHALLSSVVI